MSQLTSLQKRILSALVLGPLTIALIVLGGIPYTILIAVGAVISIQEFFMMERAGKNGVALHMAGWVSYIVLCALSFLMLRLAFADGLFLVLALMLLVWSCDIGAYFTGKAIGGPKMAPRISPNKTWAGLIGGMLSSGLVLTVFDCWRDIFSAPIGFVFLTGFVLGAVGQAGDLMISMLKRRVGVKDTGHIIPGHGGLLDRIDSLLLVTPIFLLLAALVLI